MSALPLTTQSDLFRRRAAEVGDRALKEPDTDRMLGLLHQAMSWIQLAENEEILVLPVAENAQLQVN